MYPGISDALLLPLLMCSVCMGEGLEIEGLVPITMCARPVHWVSYYYVSYACTLGFAEAVH